MASAVTGLSLPEGEVGSGLVAAGESTGFGGAYITTQALRDAPRPNAINTLAKVLAFPLLTPIAKLPQSHKRRTTLHTDYGWPQKRTSPNEQRGRIVMLGPRRLAA